jgi:Uma2 family endonuclease
MTAILPPDAEELLRSTDAPLRRMKRVEFELLVERGCYEDERVELLFGLVVPMPPVDHTHFESLRRVQERFIAALGQRATVYAQAGFPASDESLPLPDLYLAPPGGSWTRPEHVYLVIEVSRSSLRRDRAKRKLYAHAGIDEYWIINHLDRCIEVYRDRANGDWSSLSIIGPGGTVAPLAFPDALIDVDDVLPPLPS